MAESVRTLGDVLDRLRGDAAEEDRKLADMIDQATAANSPGEIERDLQTAPADSKPGPEANPTGAMAAAGRLEALARDLEAARVAIARPELERYLAIEKQAAEVARALTAAADPSKRAEAEKRLADLTRAVGALEPAPGPLRQAAEALAHTDQIGSSDSVNQPDPRSNGPRSGLNRPTTHSINAVQALSRALQAKIQELILAESLVDRDGAVPPGYRELVEDYFRVLSEDQR